VLRALSLCTCCRHYPGAATEALFARFPSRISLPRKGHRVGLRIVLFEACSAFTRVTACTLALSPYFVTRLSEGFSHFVSSIAAPVASGWSRRRVGLAPTGKRRLFTAHTRSGRWRVGGAGAAWEADMRVRLPTAKTPRILRAPRPHPNVKDPCGGLNTVKTKRTGRSLSADSVEKLDLR
jgi:hypothetical protein